MAADEESPSYEFPSLVRFDLFELDRSSCQLWRSGVPVDLPPQALKILVLLAARPNHLVTRKEIKETLWPGESYGDFDSRLNFAIKKLREALVDDAEHPRYVQTVRNAGHRFIAPVRELRPYSSALSDSSNNSRDSRDVIAAASTLTALVPGKPHSGRNVFLLVFVAATVVTSAAAALFVLRSHGRQSGLSKVQASIAGERPDLAPEILSVSSIIPQARQRIVISGEGFGLHVPYVHTDSPYLAIRDLTTHWAAGRIIPQNSDDVMVDVESWTNTEIVVSGFSGDYGRNGWKLAEGDDVEIAVWNPQSGSGPALFHVKVVPAAAPD